MSRRGQEFGIFKFLSNQDVLHTALVHRMPKGSGCYFLRVQYLSSDGALSDCLALVNPQIILELYGRLLSSGSLTSCQSRD